MVFPFGVSVSDFIAGIKLFKNAIDSLSNTRGARADFSELARSLSSLERVLKALGKVKLDTDLRTQALRQNLDACKLCLATFLVDIAKFRKLDAQYVTKARLTMMFRQIQWALCKKDDVRKFRSEIGTHIGTLEMLLATFQIESVMRVDSRTTVIETTTNEIATRVKQYAHSQAKFIEHIRETDRSQTNRLSKIANGIESCASEVKEQRNALLEFQDKLKMGLSTDDQHTMFGVLQEVFRQNEGLRQEMKDLQTQNNTLVRHVLEPVVLHDALGRIAPFHLEFIDSVAAFLAVLQIRFEHVGRPKITRLEFDLRDTARQCPIALRKSWRGVFRPGQHVDMSMQFALLLEHNHCPGCHSEEKRFFNKGESVKCQICNIIYRYGLGQASDRIHFLEDDGIDDLPFEGGDCNVSDCNVSDFCRVAIVEPRSTPEVEPRSAPEVKPKPQAANNHEASHLKPLDYKIQGIWCCPECRSMNSDLTPGFCPVCGWSSG